MAWWFSSGPEDLGKELAAIKATQAEILTIVRTIMADVKIAQEDLDATASALRAVVTKLNDADLSSLGKADQTGIVGAVSDLTDVVNRITGSATPDVPTPNPDPEPSDTEPEAPQDPAEA